MDCASVGSLPRSAVSARKCKLLVNGFGLDGLECLSMELSPLSLFCNHSAHSQMSARAEACDCLHVRTNRFEIRICAFAAPTLRQQRKRAALLAPPRGAWRVLQKGA